MQRPAAPSHVANDPLYLPKLAEISGSMVTLPVSNFGVLVRLKVSQRNLSLWPSDQGMDQAEAGIYELFTEGVEELADWISTAK